MSRSRIAAAALFAAFMLLPWGKCHAADAEGDPDISFIVPDFGAAVRAVAIQADGKVLVGGSFTSVAGFATKGVARLNANGSLDTTFKAELSGSPFEVRALCVQPDGKIIVGGQFGAVGAVARGNFARLLEDGSLDPGFAPGLQGADGKVNVISLQPDAKILVGGTFIKMHGQARGRIARLDSDGALDEQFAVGLNGANFSVADIALQGDKKILIGGYFTKVNDTNRARIARLNADGVLDESFVAAANGNVLGVALQYDSKVVLVGEFANVLGKPRQRIARVNSDGTLDETFTAAADGKVSAVMTQIDGNVLIGGEFAWVNAVSRGRIARLDPAGLLDSAFSAGAGADSYIDAMAQQADGKIVVVGDFTSIGGQLVKRVARLRAAVPSPRDVTPPVIVLKGHNPMTVVAGNSFIDPGAIVADDIDPARDILGTGTVDTARPGTYTITYGAADASGKTAAPVTRTVVVAALPPIDMAKPVITLLGKNPLHVLPGALFEDPGATVTDGIDPARDILGTGTVDTARPGTYTITYGAVDASGKAADPVTRTVHVTAISKLELLKSSLTVMSGKKAKAVILLSNNATVKEWENLQIEILEGGTFVTVPAKLFFKAAGKTSSTSPPKIKRVSLTIAAATGQTGRAKIRIGYKGHTAELVITVK